MGIVDHSDTDRSVGKAIAGADDHVNGLAE
jgi:hypothetical protein